MVRRPIELTFLEQCVYSSLQINFKQRLTAKLGCLCENDGSIENY